MKARGFSLVEVLAAFAIVAVVAAAAAPSLARAVEREQFKASARELAAALRSARQEALATQAETIFTIDVESETYEVGGAPAQALRAPKRAVFTLITARQEQSSDSAGSIRFFPDGSSTGGTIAVTLDERQLVVLVDWLTGRVQIEGT